MTTEITRDDIVIRALVSQRNAAMDQLASTLADLEIAKARVAQLEEATVRLQALEVKIAAIEAQGEAQ